ncbi:MAG: CoA pyrophosphatase [Burkholderiales bacterium]|nr:CoA pyrophosphatase [Burkholderiales bacterium]
MSSLPSPVIDLYWLRQRFATARAFSQPLAGDGVIGGALPGQYPTEDRLRPAAVLVPLIERGPELTVLFTRRTDHLHHHAGQISFPGGRAEPADATALVTALRETEEEIGLAQGRIEVLGCLQDYRTVTGYRVTPVVGLVRAPFDLQPDDFEVAEIFEVPLPFLMDPGNHMRKSGNLNGMKREYYSLVYGRYDIWGATAGIVVNLHAFLTSD